MFRNMFFLLLACFAFSASMSEKTYFEMVSDQRIARIIRNDLETLIDLLSDYATAVESFYKEYQEKHPNEDLDKEKFTEYVENVSSVHARFDSNFAQRRGYTGPITSDFICRALPLVFLGVYTDSIPPEYSAAAEQLEMLRTHRLYETRCIARTELNFGEERDKMALQAARGFCGVLAERGAFYTSLGDILDRTTSRKELLYLLLGDLDVLRVIDWESDFAREEQLGKLRPWNQQLFKLNKEHRTKVQGHLKSSFCSLFFPIEILIEPEKELKMESGSIDSPLNKMLAKGEK